MASPPAFLDIAAAGKRFGAVTVLDGVDLAVARCEIVSLLGPSGCGKTTLLRIIAGLLPPDRGTVRLDGEDITAKPPHRRDVGVVFQNYALFPHLTVAENVAFGLEARRVARAEIAKTVPHLLALVHLAELADRSIKLLSGGQQQRVAVARALAVQAQAHAVRRAVLRPRPQATRDHADRAQAPAARGRRHRDLRHPRSGRGADHVGSGGGHEPGHDRAAGRAGEHLPSAGDAVRARLRRALDPALRRRARSRGRRGRGRDRGSERCARAGGTRQAHG